MTHQRLPGQANPTDPYVLTVKITDHQYDLYATVSVQVDVETVGGVKATLARWERAHDDLDRVPEVMKDLADAMLWGDGLRAVISQVQSEDRSAQSRRARQAALGG